MSRKIAFGGTTYVVPDDATDDEITGIVGKQDVGATPTPAAALNSIPRPKLDMQEQPLSTFQKGLTTTEPGDAPIDDTLQRAGDKVESTATNLGIGSARSLGRVANNVSEGISKVAPSLVRPSDVAGLKEMEKDSNPTQKVGGIATDIGTYMMAPEAEAAGAIAKIPGLAKIAGGAIPRVLAAAATGGTMNKLHGGDFTSGAETGGLLSSLGEAAKPLADAVKDYIPQRLYNAIARTSPKGFNYGRNPGQGVADSGIVAGSQGSMLSKIGDELEATGKEIGQKLANPQTGQPLRKNMFVDISKSITDPIDQMEAAAIQHKNLDLADRLKDLRSRLTTDYARDATGKLVPTGPTRLQGLTPAQANDVKQALGQMTRWTGDPKVDELAPAIQQAYRGVNDRIEAAEPGIKGVNQKYGELKSAYESLDHKIRLGEKYNPLGSLTDILSGLHWGPSGYLGSKLLRSTPMMSMIGQAARKAPEGLDLLRRAATGAATSQ